MTIATPALPTAIGADTLSRSPGCGIAFVCLLPDTDLRGAMVLAQQLGAAVHAQHIEHADSDVAAVVTLSLGVCSKGEVATGSAVALLREADAQLYKAKSLGRHQACGAALTSP